MTNNHVSDSLSGHFGQTVWTGEALKGFPPLSGLGLGK